VPGQDGWLAPEEAAYLAGLRFPKRHADWRLGRYAAKRALAAYLHRSGDDRSLAALAVRAAPDGAPEAFLDGVPLPLVLSLSHRDGLALCVLTPAGTALGCDLEKVEPRSAAFVADYFTPAERDAVAAAPETERPVLANLVWAAKECVLKALRTGLRTDTRAVEVEVSPFPAASAWRPMAARYVPDGRCFEGWWRSRGEHVLAVAASPPPGPPVPLGTGKAAGM
jgi:4'-phosphopantetheinyl transferase